VTTTGDCNDANAMVHPGATEVCNGVDDDCAGGIDNGLTFVSYYATPTPTATERAARRAPARR